LISLPSSRLGRWRSETAPATGIAVLRITGTVAGRHGLLCGLAACGVHLLPALHRIGLLMSEESSVLGATRDGGSLAV
jgi:hypothetical protein